ncbi:phosphoribosylformylglycinamidine synthase subunit PurS [Sandarakinorhabdus rubra]|uniref:phosphoribosylformylglycinamidine synthase subunit PurS n=1 Tax=Sandarakinorhabdus rubra TaxID=2672568 RepID=UPI0013DCE230|nr:phosphoribosylformylglycinamidine synthase subunit PurS [Sandarakinorhabdus rubra]
MPEAAPATRKATVTVTLKNGVLDPQGRAIEAALHGLGFDGVAGARVGKIIELDVADGTSRETVEAMARQLLANTVIENFRIEMP